VDPLGVGAVRCRVVADQPGDLGQRLADQRQIALNSGS
jgi:hypothetical protein